MQKRFLYIAGITGALAVLLGAFGAHGLKSQIGPQALENWHTGVNYQFYHTFALLAIGILSRKTDKWLNIAGWLYLAGIVCFSGSLYLLATYPMHGLPKAILGPITPLGGLLFIGGWVTLIVGVWLDRRTLE